MLALSHVVDEILCHTNKLHDINIEVSKYMKSLNEPVNNPFEILPSFSEKMFHFYR
jgi:hypothetical protein